MSCPDQQDKENHNLLVSCLTCRLLCVFVCQEYVLAHTEMPTTLEGAEAAIKKQEDFMTTMDANEEKISSVVDTGRRLVADGNINAERIQEKVDSIDQR